MSAPRLSVEKAAFSNIFVGIRATIEALRNETGEWQGWEQATAEGFKAYSRKIRQLTMNEELLHSLENLATQKKTRKRPSTGGLKSRNILVMCADCGYKARITRMWIDVGIPKCPNPDCDSFDKEMAQDETFTDEGETVGAQVLAHEAEHGTKEYHGEEEVGAGFQCSAHKVIDCPICNTV